MNAPLFAAGATASAPPTLLDAVVHSIRQETAEIISLDLRPASAAIVFPAFEAGAHVDLHLANGLVRSYSLLNADTDHQRYVVAVLKDRHSRGGSTYVHEQLRQGETLTLSAPRNHFKLDEGAHPTVLVGGGIGITPLLCMLRRLVALRRQVHVVYCARSRADAAFCEEIQALAGDTVQLCWHFDDAAGAPPDFSHLLAGHPPQTHLYGCGPTPMLDAFEQAGRTLGYPNVHVERFAAAGPVPVNDHRYTVELRRSGLTFDVLPGQSLLDTLLEAGVNVDCSCREGVCGACAVPVLAGQVDHRDSLLSDEERASNTTMLACVSGCMRGPLVLDV